MLILTRHRDETIIIDGGRIKIHVCNIYADKVRIGVEAPPDVVVHREEVQRKIDSGQRAPRTHKPRIGVQTKEGA